MKKLLLLIFISGLLPSTSSCMSLTEISESVAGGTGFIISNAVCAGIPSLMLFGGSLLALGVDRHSRNDNVCVGFDDIPRCYGQATQETMYEALSRQTGKVAIASLPALVYLNWYYCHYYGAAQD